MRVNRRFLKTSGLYDNTDYTAEGDPDFGFECFAKPQFSTAPQPNQTVFFSFVEDGNRYRIAAPPCNATDPVNGIADTQMALYRGACGNLTALACNEDPRDGSTFITAVTVDTEVGEQYYFLVNGSSNNDATNGSGEFCLEVTNLQLTFVRLFSQPKERPAPIAGPRSSPRGGF